MKQKTRFKIIGNIGYRHRPTVQEWPLHRHRPQKNTVDRYLILYGTFNWYSNRFNLLLNKAQISYDNTSYNSN